MKRTAALATAALAVVLASSSACGNSSGSTATPAGGGKITVLAAASLTEAFTDDRAHLVASHSAIDPTFSFEGSQQVVAQVLAGAPADVVATADDTSMQRLVTAHAVETPQVLARNRLEIAVRPGNPARVTALSDLTRPGLRVVLADPSVPAGRYSRQALAQAGLTVRPVSQPLDVKAALQLVATGEADAAIVYTTDVLAAARTVTGVAIPGAQNILATYLVAVVRASPHRAASAAFVDQLLSGAGRRILAGRGFQSP